MQDHVTTCTNVVFPDPAIPRQMMHVGLLDKLVSLVEGVVSASAMMPK